MGGDYKFERLHVPSPGNTLYEWLRFEQTNTDDDTSNEDVFSPEASSISRNGQYRFRRASVLLGVLRHRRQTHRTKMFFPEATIPRSEYRMFRWTICQLFPSSVYSITF